MYILHADENMKKLFPSKSVKTLCRRHKYLKEIVTFLVSCQT